MIGTKRHEWEEDGFEYCVFHDRPTSAEAHEYETWADEDGDWLMVDSHAMVAKFTIYSRKKKSMADEYPMGTPVLIDGRRAAVSIGVMDGDGVLAVAYDRTRFWARRSMIEPFDAVKWESVRGGAE